MKNAKLHPVYCLKYFRYILVLCIGPVWGAFLARDPALVFSLLREDFYLFLALAFLALAFWFATGYHVTPHAIVVEQGLFFQRTDTLPLENVAAIGLERSFFYRLVGATRLTLYFSAPMARARYSFPLPKQRAEDIIDGLFPGAGLVPFFKPRGGGHFAYALLSTDLLASLAVIAGTYFQLRKFLGPYLESTAIIGFGTLNAFAQIYLPAGLAVTATLALLLFLAVMAKSVLQTGGFSAAYNKKLLVVEGGLFTHREYRVLRSKITSSTLRVSFSSRLAGRYPLYVAAGGYSGLELPVFLYRKGDTLRVQSLLPGFSDPFVNYCNPKVKSLGRYLWAPGVLFSISVLTFALCATRMPSLVPICTIPLLFSLVMFAFAAEGILKEGANKIGGTLVLSTSKTFSRHITHVYTQHYLLRASTTSLGALRGVCTLVVTTGDRRRLKARSLEQNKVRLFFATPGVQVR